MLGGILQGTEIIPGHQSNPGWRHIVRCRLSLDKVIMNVGILQGRKIIPSQSNHA